MSDYFSFGSSNNEGAYFQKFQIAQRNFELVCEEHKGTRLCKKQRLWRERKGNSEFNSSVK